MIKHEGSKWVLYSQDGKKVLGEFDSEEEAMKREKQIMFFKHKGESEGSDYFAADIAPRAVEGEGDSAPFEGHEWDVTVIGGDGDNVVNVDGREYIKSKNNRLYAVDGLKNSASAWENIQVYDNHLTDSEFTEKQGMRSFGREWIGAIVAPKWDAAKRQVRGILKVIDESIAKKLKAAHEAGILKTFGLSIDTKPQWGQVVYEGQTTPVVEGFEQIYSVDLVMRPAAGGGFNRLIAAQTLQGEIEMTPEEIQALIVKGIAEALAAKEAEALAAKEAEEAEEAKKKAETEAAAPVAPVAPPAPVADPVVAEAVRKLECKIALRDALDEAKLDAPHRKLVNDLFTGKVFMSADLDKAIAHAKEAQSAVDPSGRVTDAGSAPVIQVGMNELDKHTAEFMDLVFGSQARRMSEAKESFVSERINESHKAWIKAGYPHYHTRYVSEWVYGLLGGVDPLDEERMREAITTSSMSSIVKNALNVMLACDYAAQQRWWDPIVTTEEVETIDDATLVRVFGLSTLAVVDEGQAYSELAGADEEETASFVKKGGYVGVTLETLLKEKGAVPYLRSLPSRLAKSWYNTLSALNSSVFTCNTATGPVLTTTGALFNSSAVTGAGGHANLLTTAFSHDAYTAARTAMMKQTDQPLGAGRKLLIRPRYILIPVDMEAAVNVEFNTETLSATANNGINPYFKECVPIVVPDWTDANNWALVADKTQFPAIYNIFLRGRQVPELFTAGDETSGAMFTNDTLRYKVRWLSYQFSSTYTCAPVADFRPLHKSNC